MALCSFSKQYTASTSTGIENAFIYDYLPDASPVAVKVYVYGLFLCQNDEFDKTITEFAKELNLSEAEVIDCFKYWEEFDLVTILNLEPFAVQYLPVHKGAHKVRRFNPEKYSEFTASVQALIPNRMISTNEFTEYFSVMEVYHIKPEAMIMIIKYCVDLKGADIGYKYIIAVAKDFGNRGITKVEKVEKELENYLLRTSEIAQILLALNSKRKPELDDLKLFEKWTKEFGFEFESILHAAKKVKKSSITKLDEFICKLYNNKWFSIEQIDACAKNNQKLYELAIKINKTLSVYYEVLDPVVDNYVSKWITSGFEEDALIIIANYCFKHSKNTLEQMDGILSSLAEEGIFTYSAIADYFKQRAESDKFLKEILETAGISRKPTSWDRKNLKLWLGWNFSFDMIREAAQISCGKQNPIAYINAVLGNWKSQNIFSVEQIKSAEKDTKANGKKPLKNTRTYTKEELDSLITDIDDIDF